jgi:hypothetical protein
MRAIRDFPHDCYGSFTSFAEVPHRRTENHFASAQKETTSASPESSICVTTLAD